MQKKIWNVFVPNELLFAKPGYLLGIIDHDNCMIFINGILHSYEEIKQSKQRNVGCWQISNPDLPISDPGITDPLITINLTNHGSGNFVSCHLTFRASCAEVCPIVCIFYEPKDLELSYVLHQTISADYDSSAIIDLHSKLVDGSGGKADSDMRTTKLKNCQDNYSLKELQDNENVLAFLVRNVSLEAESMEKTGMNTLFRNQMKLSHSLAKLISTLWLPLTFTLMMFICHVGRLFSIGKRWSCVCCGSVAQLVHAPSIIRHIQTQASHFRRILILKRTEKFNLFLLYNHCGNQLLDTCLGIGIILWITQNDLAMDIGTFTIDWADDVAHKLTTLVQWLMGAPAGLKLNSQLTKFLGHFFIYHIYLWSGYLSLLRSVMPSVIWYCSWIGIFGMSAQLCLVRDVLSMLTLHIYCFYVYAARIFNFQVYALGSLWRLFLGKKWNVLRSRVDSASYNTDQLFVGTLLFTVLLFLLPTTALYYAVFTLLRLVVLTVQGCLQQAISLLCSIPVFTILLRLLTPKLVAGSARFEIRHVPDDSKSLILSMQTCQIPLKKLLALTAWHSCTHTSPTYTWSEFLSHLATGRLIYPWVESHTKKGKVD
ncbi:unnamed protein product [Lymnaea stagnalis]|uniref:Phosphatidylinositol N-acetylglucosaminyltransferase subunit Q n=1 Tax=Lymnaea stagnalis TaxID=6523 RepID=A0AAV2ID66_LYMST